MLQDDVVAYLFQVLARSGDFVTAGALCIATPRQGVAAIKAHKDWKNNPAFSIAVRLHSVGKQALDQALFRKYAHEKRAQTIHLEWMNDHSDDFSIQVEKFEEDEGMVEEWLLVDNRDMYYQDDQDEEDVSRGILLRVTTLWDGEIRYFGGPGHINALVRWERSNGNVHYFSTDLVHEEEDDGEPRLTCIQHNNGKSFTYYEGEPGNERKVRVEQNDKIRYYTGNKGEERRIYTRYPDGSIQHYSGARQEERITRLEKNNKTIYFTGIKGQEKITKIRLSDGRVIFYAGATGVERMKRMEFHSGSVIHFRGVKGQERKVMLKKANGEVRFFQRDGRAAGRA